MAVEVHQFTVVIPANTPKATLAVVKMKLNLFDIESIDIEVPPGPSGLMGFYLALSGQQWIPWEMGEFLIWDDRAANWPLTEQPTSYGWEVHGYNLDVYDHSIVVRFHVNLVSVATPQIVPPTINFVTSQVPVKVTTL